jgi:hypothetical protein
MYDYTSYSWSHWNSNEKPKVESGSDTGKTLDRFTTADSCAGNITHSAESAAVWNLSVGGGGHCWFKRVIGKKRHETGDNNNKNNNNNISDSVNNNNNIFLLCKTSFVTRQRISNCSNGIGNCQRSV